MERPQYTNRNMFRKGSNSDRNNFKSNNLNNMLDNNSRDLNKYQMIKDLIILILMQKMQIKLKINFRNY